MSTFLKPTDIPLHGARTLPGRCYTSADVFADELDRIFLRQWICIGRASRVARPGDYVLVAIGSESVIVLRDRAGIVRAFYNVCRHRGTRLCEAPHGTLAGTIQCPYHAWTYALDGRLVGVPSGDSFEGLDKRDFPLRPVALAEWEGFLFVNLADEPRPFAEAFAPILDRFARFRIPELVVGREIAYDVRANWKLVVQNYSECYHCAPVHPQLVRLSPPTSGENDLWEGAVLGGFMMIVEDAASMTMSGRACGLPVGDLPAEDHRRVYYYAIFPNLLLSLHPDYVMAHVLWPEEPGRTRIVCDWLFRPETLAGGWDIDDGVRFWDTTNRQDWHMCEQSQLGVASKAYEPAPYSGRESLLAAFDRHYRGVMEG